MSFELQAASWASCTLGDIVDAIETGKSVKCDERPPQGDEAGLVKISAVTWGEFDEQESKTLLDTAHLLPQQKIHAGDFLITRANTLELVGACVLVKSISKNLYLSDKVLRLAMDDRLKKWLLVCLRSHEGRKQIESLATGNQLSMRNISQQALREIRIPLPPLAEQARIAARLDELLAQVDTLKARIDGIPALLKRFRQSVLAAAVSGRLTEEWRSHPVNAYETKPLGTLVAEPLRNGKSVKDGTGQRVLRLSALKLGGIDFLESKCGDWSGIDVGRYLVQEGDFLVSRGNGSKDLVGRGGLVGDVAENMAYPDTMIRIRPSQEVLTPEYLAVVWNGQVIRKQIEAVARTTAGIWKISQGDLEALKIPLPDVAEQTEIVRRVEQLFAFADQLEARVNQARSRIDRLTQSILAKAFRGELVPQDPNDEPASALLQRIQAQRAAAPKPRRTRKKASSA